jgi:23S rRNA pseudouridine2605 synthase
MAAERLHKILARAGVASLRASEALIASGRVTVNGTAVVEAGARADPEADEIAVDGVLLGERGRLIYLLMNKPPGVITSASDERGRRTVLDLLPAGLPRLFPVGRLDLDSEGLLILTNDGELTHRLTHPSREVEKEYLVEADRQLSREDMHRAVRGVEEGGERLRLRSLRAAGRTETGHRYVAVLTEGKKREIRRIFGAFGVRVSRLIRLREGPLQLGTLEPGAVRALSRAEVEALRAAAGLAAAPVPVHDPVKRRRGPGTGDSKARHRNRN